MAFSTDYDEYLKHWGKNYAGQPNATTLMPQQAQSLAAMDRYMQQGLLQMGPGNKYIPSTTGATPAMPTAYRSDTANALMAPPKSALLPPAPPARKQPDLSGVTLPDGSSGKYASLKDLTADIKARYPSFYSSTFQPALAARGLSGDEGIPNAPQGGDTPVNGGVEPGTLSVRMPDGNVRTFNSIDESLNQALTAGGIPLNENGQSQTVSQMGGGWLVNGQPLNQVFRGEGALTPEQRALLSTGQGIPYTVPGATPPAVTPPAVTPPVVEPPVGNAPMTTGNTTLPTFNKDTDPNEMMSQLMNYILQQGQAGAQNLTGPMGNLQNLLAYGLAGSTQKYDRQHQLTQQLLGAAMPAVASSIGNMNDRTGLSPEALAVLRTQATERPAEDYQSQVSDLKTQLLRRGAAGGMTPAALDEMVRGYSPLMVGRDQSRQQLQQNVTLTDEQVANENLYKNRALGMQGAGLAGQLMQTVGQTYNPNDFLGQANQAAQGVLSGANMQNNSNANASQQAALIAQIQSSNAPESLKNILIAALIPNVVKPIVSKLTETAVNTGLEAAKKSSWWSKVLSFLPFGGGGTSASQREDDLAAFVRYMQENYPQEIQGLGLSPDLIEQLKAKAPMNVGPI